MGKLTPQQCPRMNNNNIIINKYIYMYINILPYILYYMSTRPKTNLITLLIIDFGLILA